MAGIFTGINTCLTAPQKIIFAPKPAVWLAHAKAPQPGTLKIMSAAMKSTFGLVRRPWGVFRLKNKITGEKTSLKTSNKQEAQRLLNDRNEAESQTQFNAALARVYLNGAGPNWRSAPGRW